MINEVVLGVGGLLCTAFGALFVWRQHHRRMGTHAGWGATMLGLGLITRAASFLAGSRQPLGLIISVCYAVFWIGGFTLLRRGRNTLRNGRGRRERRKTPPLPP